ncbi:MAG: phosphoribosyltransferase [Candidatus Micrarchaeota archaeon]
MKFLRISWGKFEKMCSALSRKVVKYKPEVLIGISRGGLVPVRIMSDMLNIQDIQTIRIQFYRTIGKTNSEPKLTQGQDIHIKGKRVLVIDDIADTGKSLLAAQKYLKQKTPKMLKFATFHYKPASLFKPDYYLKKTNDWIIYPWEKLEMERELKALNQR